MIVSNVYAMIYLMKNHVNKLVVIVKLRNVKKIFSKKELTSPQ